MPAFKCQGLKPAKTAACPKCAFCEDYAQYQGCSKRGPCRSDACTCNPGTSGSICDIDLDCASEVLTPEKTCCASGVVDAEGACCEGGVGGVVPTVDYEGACCAAGSVDACGVCGGSGTAVDVHGECCEVRLAP